MLDPYKVRLMAKAETVRQEDRDLLQVARLKRSGYVLRGMLKTFLGVTIAFALLLALYVTHVGAAENAAGSVPARGVITWLVLYAAAVAIWLIVSFFLFRWRYDRKTEQVEEYHDCLRRLKRLQ